MCVPQIALIIFQTKREAIEEKLFLDTSPFCDLDPVWVGFRIKSFHLLITVMIPYKYYKHSTTPSSQGGEMLGQPENS